MSKERNNFQLGLYAGLDVSGLKGHSRSVFGLLEPLFNDETATEVHVPKKKRKEKNDGEGKEQSGRKRVKPAIKYDISQLVLEN